MKLQENILSLLFASCAAAAFAEPLVADFSGASAPAGWTVNNGEYRSPEYPGAVDRIELAYAGDIVSASASLYASNSVSESQIATFTAASSAAAFDFPDTTDFRSFRIVTANGLSLSSFAAYMSSSALDAPGGVAISNNTTGTSFDASWQPVVGATGYRVYVWTNAVAGASAGTVAWQETFANAPSTTSTQTRFKKEHTDSGTSEWIGESAYICSYAGAVRIGTTKGKGSLVSPSLPSFSDLPLTLRITAWRQTTSEGQDMPLGIVSGGETNIVGYVRLGDAAATFNIALPELNDGDRIAIFSPTNNTSARAIIDDVAILSGYSEGSLAPSYIVNGQDAGAATSWHFESLPSVAVSFAVEAYGRRGALSAKTEAVTVDLSNPDKVATLNACPLSSLDGGGYAQDFDALAAVTATTGDKEWLNGTTLQYWQAYTNGAAVNSIKWNGGKSTTKGLYALRAGSSPGGSDRALGACSVQGIETSFGIAFTNDTDVAMDLSAVSYSAQQWGFGNTATQTLSVSAQVVGSLDWMSAYGAGWTELGATHSTVYESGDKPETAVSSTVSFNPASNLTIAPGQILLLKWTVNPPASGSAAMLGIDDVTVTFPMSPVRGFAIRLAGVSVRSR